MKISKPQSDLISRLSQDNNAAPKQLPCALTLNQPCCEGKGFQIAKKGAYAVGMLCACVQNCLACHGHLSKVSANTASACKIPSPRTIINIINEAELPARYYQAEFESFANFTGNCRDHIHTIRKWAQGFQLGGKGLIISGPVGVGKTYLLACIIKTLAYKGIKSKFIDFFQLINEIKGAYSDQKSDQSIIAPLIDVDVLIVDELGKGRNTEFELTILDQLIMGRYNQDKVIVASTNYSLQENQNKATSSRYQSALDEARSDKTGQFAPDQFGHLEERIESRIFSRLKETTMYVTLTGSDYRRRSR